MAQLDIPLNLSNFIHGGDYNPEQWMHIPGTWDEDMRLMKLAHVNSASVGIFSWATLEPAEGRFNFGWLDDILDKLAKNDALVVLATPSGAKPHWMAYMYPEIRRVNQLGQRDTQKDRHNHCWTSPVYREKVRIINSKLAARYQDYKNLVLWHLSNEYGGYCYCELCLAAFQDWLKTRYQTLDALNQAYWTTFWSHTYTSWDQIRAIDPNVHGLVIDWRRFMTHQCCTFIDNESAPLRELTPHVPTTTNLMGSYLELNQHEMVKHIDVVSWDNYPAWHRDADLLSVASYQCMMHDMNRAHKGGKPFLLMESTPSQMNWQATSRLKRPGVNRLAGLSALAHGSDGVSYFQWRKSRGGKEKFHGAVVDHLVTEHTRVFREVTALGADLETLSPLVSSRIKAEAALIYDWENRWAIDGMQHYQNARKNFESTSHQHYIPLWKRSIATDIISAEAPLEGYKLVIAPMLHMIRPGVAEAIEAYVKAGGIFVTTYLAGMVNETDLVFQGGFPGPLRKLLGIWVEETDALWEDQTTDVVSGPGNPLGLSGRYKASDICDLLHLEGAAALATYGSEFYQGMPALTRHKMGKGWAYYVASRNDGRFMDDFLAGIVQQAQVKPVLDATTPAGVTMTRRSRGGRSWVFIMNWTDQTQHVTLPGDARELISGQTGRDIELAAYDVRVVEA